MKIKVALLLITSCFGLTIIAFSQDLQWPLENSNQQGQITGTMGEYRFTTNTGPHRWHAGVDISPATTIYAMNSGSARWNLSDGNFSTISIVDGSGETVQYIHVVPATTIRTNSEIGMDTEVTAGNIIGTTVVMNGRHLHLELGDVAGGTLNANFLQSRLTPYVDSATPIVRSTTNLSGQLENGVEFFQNGLNANTINPQNLELNSQIQIEGNEHTIVYGKVDIVADVVDRWTATNGNSAGTGQLAPFGFEWMINNMYGVELINETLLFDRFPNNANAAYGFHPNSVSPGNPSLYILTVDPHNNDQNIRDRWWNTGLASGLNEDWSLTQNRTVGLDARLNEESELKDNRYLFTLDAYDVDYADNPNNRLAAEVELNLLIDNFKPFIERLDINYSVDGVTYTFAYKGEWIWQNDQLNFVSSGDPSVSPVDFVQFIIYASEPLSTDTGFEPTIQIEGIANPVAEPFLSDNTFTFTLPSGSFRLDGGDNGTKTITINGYDLAHNQITGFGQPVDLVTEDELPVRLSETLWSGTLQSRVDTRHILNVGGSSCAPPGGRIASGDCPLIADFAHSPLLSDPSTIVFSDLSVPQGEITSWQWDFGDGSAYSTLKDPSHSYQFTGDYPVTLTVTRAAEQDTRMVIVTVTNDPLVANFTVSTNSGTAPLIVDLNSSNSIGNIQTWDWQITPPSGFQYVIGNSQSANPSVRFDNAGSYSINLTIDDGVSSATSANDQINVASGTAPILDFTWNGNIYAGLGTLFISEAGFECFSNLTYSWTFENGFPSASNQVNPLITFNTIGMSTVQLCVTDACNVTQCITKGVDVKDPNGVNQDLIPNFYFYAGFPVENEEDILGYEIQYEKDEVVEFIDYSQVRSDIKAWSWWFQQSVGFSRDLQQTGPNNYYESYQASVSHQYTDPGKYMVRLFVFEDIGFAGPNHDRIIVIRRPIEFCASNIDIQNIIYAYGETTKEISGEINVGSITDEVTAENGSEVQFVSTRTHLTGRVHFHSGSKVTIKPGDCDEVRSTFE